MGEDWNDWFLIGVVSWKRQFYEMTFSLDFCGKGLLEGRSSESVTFLKEISLGWIEGFGLTVWDEELIKIWRS